MKIKLLSVHLLLVTFAVGQISPLDRQDLPESVPDSYSGEMPSSSSAIRTTAWSHPYGNLVANWSFENPDQFWSSGVGATVRSLRPNASSGFYVASAGAEAGDGLLSETISMLSGKEYILSIKVRGSITEDISPKIQFLLPSSNVVSEIPGSRYSPISPNEWTAQNWSFTVPSGGDRSARLVLFSGDRPSDGHFLELDDVVLTERLDGATEIDRAKFVEAISVSDPTGIGYHNAVRSGAEISFQIQASGYDRFWRSESSYLSSEFQRGQGVYEPIPNALELARASNPGAGATPVQVLQYPNPGNLGISRKFNSGDDWSTNSGRAGSTGSFFWPTLPSSSSSLPESFENPTVPSGEKNYRLNWSCNSEGIYIADWTDIRGRLLVRGTLLDKSGGSTPNQWNWVFTNYEYYPTGQLKRILTPLSATVAPVVTSYDQMGRVIASNSPDEGLVRYWYGLSGQLRFRQKASQIPLNQYTYYSYDDLGRVISEGEVVIPLMTQEIANTLGSEDDAESKVERKGWIYDNLLTGWPARSDLPPLSVVEGNEVYGVANAMGRLVAKYNRNPQYALPNLDVSRKLVVEFYDYDDRGRVKRVGKYFGAVENEENRNQNVSFFYDSAGHVDRRIVDRNLSAQGMESRSPDVDYLYTYDDKGRLSSISDANIPLTEYGYDAKGRLVQVELGGGAASRIRYSYHFHGQPLEILAQSSLGVPGGAWKIQYDQKLGYENSAAGDVPQLSEPSYLGRISQIREQYGADVNILLPSPISGVATQPLKTINYSYDASGRMTRAVAWTGIDEELSSGDEAIADSWSTALELGGIWEYDENDRISRTQVGGAEVDAQYSYLPGGNRLGNVFGPLRPGSTRDLSSIGVLEYDEDGNLIFDNSKSKWVQYDAGGLPKYIGSNDPGVEGGKYIWPLYDADGQMVSAVKTINGPTENGPLESIHYIRLAGAPQKEIRERFQQANGELVSTIQVVNLLGQESVIGRKIDGNLYYYLKNHQGSTVKVVNDHGETVAAYDYGPYGDLRVLREASVNQTQKWTGKEYFDEPGLYYFGARWYDPELGLWISPDPAHSEMSPYAYVGGDPMNYIDPYGLWKFGAGLTIGYDSDNGFNIGVGVAADFDAGFISMNVDASQSYGFESESWTSTASAGGGVHLGIVDANAYAGGSYNTKTGYSVFGGVAAGAFGVGAQADASAYWDKSGDYIGALVGVGSFVGSSTTGAYSGYQWGFGGMQGMGWNAGVRALGARAGYSENGGFGWGISSRVAGWQMDNNFADGSVVRSSYTSVGDYYSEQWADAKSAYSAVRGGVLSASSALYRAFGRAEGEQVADVWALQFCGTAVAGGGVSLCGGIGINDEDYSIKLFSSDAVLGGGDISVSGGWTRTRGNWADYSGRSYSWSLGGGPASYTRYYDMGNRPLGYGLSYSVGVLPATATLGANTTRVW